MGILSENTGPSCAIKFWASPVKLPFPGARQALRERERRALARFVRKRGAAAAAPPLATSDGGPGHGPQQAFTFRKRPLLFIAIVRDG
jgi:hypothetical protein